jgi:ABC-type transport system involved in multi-copper enzyme maturation permease subunit
LWKDSINLDASWKNDLPDRFDPMTVKELRQSLRRGSFVYPFLAIQAFAVIATMAEFSKGQASSSSEWVGVLNPGMLADAGPFWIVVSAICMLLMPMGGVILMGQELEEGNHELLLLTKLNRWRVVIGKFVTLWGLCVLTFVSLLPYVVVRYLIGGVEWVHEAACAGTTLGGSAILCAGAIGASAFTRTVARFGVLVLFIASMSAGSAVSLVANAMTTGGCGVIYHISAFAAVICHVAMGLAVARARLRLSFLAYEMDPSKMLIGLMFFSPFVIGIITAVTVGWGGFVGLLGVAVVAVTMDVTPRAPQSVAAPPPDLPVAEA